MPGYYDVYALAPARTAEAVERFLARFAPAREPAADEYEVPRYADVPATVFRTPGELVAHGVAHPAEPHGLYWRCLGGSDPAHAMAFFTADGGLILGLSVVSDAEWWRAELLAAAGSTVGWVGFEEPPPDTAREFAVRAARHAEPGAAPDTAR
ncbi:hypothetical protein R5W24_006607 [Gemmata sp. JC717]|uniref:Uncharacterized protein n=1 Tax=Gemmata algarum TaxID=2975278 RepID=A0ABU5EXV2_9BACT|nr:hypothetical protein [Gemmata algarum]MDY3557416.1 hypothetical protein [Gemmata algarum]MDY3559292.1 hypothetical protein [Gemmata algarum]